MDLIKEQNAQEQIIQEEVSLFYGVEESTESGFVLVDMGVDFFVFEQDEPISRIPRYAVWSKGDHPELIDSGTDPDALRKKYNIQ